MVEVHHGVDAFQGDLLVGAVGGHAHDVPGKADEAGQAVLVDVPRPAGPEGGEARAVGHVEHTAHLVLEFVGHKVAAGDAAAGQAIVRETARPHHLGPGLVVGRVGVEDDRILHHGAQQALGQRVGQLHIAAIGEIALHGVHHDVGAAGLGLIVGQGLGELGVHEGELRAADVVVVGPLLVGVHPGDDAAVGCFTARRRDGQDAGHRQALPGRAGVFVQLPDVLFRLGQAVGDGLGRVDDAAAAHGQQEVDAVLFADADALVDLVEVGVRHDAAQRPAGNAGLSQRIFGPVQHAGADSALAAVDDEDTGAAVFAHQRAHALFGAFAEDDPGGGVELEIACHSGLPPCKCCFLSKSIHEIDSKIYRPCACRRKMSGTKQNPHPPGRKTGGCRLHWKTSDKKTCRLEAVASPQSAGCLLLRSHSLLTSISSFFGLYRTFHRRFSFETVKNDQQGNEFLSTLE